ncbi:unnamed protein product [Arabis nemorensis]|uniref:Auxin-responsive protein n=1 Tax=Arabis nemorensis TaxID=586526 RepID=A0A565BFK2_9BRAS|nr:unnamed protein product [Arabis nemorensis]
MSSSSLATEDENSVVSSANILAYKVEADSSPVVKNQVVGWPPVCSYRRKKKNEECSGIFCRIVRIKCVGLVLKNGEKCEYAIIYEDKDGDWMLVGDVPWQMFKDSCKRLRIVKRSYAAGFGLQ